MLKRWADPCALVSFNLKGSQKRPSPASGPARVGSSRSGSIAIDSCSVMMAVRRSPNTCQQDTKGFGCTGRLKIPRQTKVERSDIGPMNMQKSWWNKVALSSSWLATFELCGQK